MSDRGSLRVWPWSIQGVLHFHTFVLARQVGTRVHIPGALGSGGKGVAMKRGTAASLGLLSPCAAGAYVATVEVEGGAILGATGSDGAVVRFLGVPFAAPPIAALRWQPPEQVV